MRQDREKNEDGALFMLGACPPGQAGSTPAHYAHGPGLNGNRAFWTTIATLHRDVAATEAMIAPSSAAHRRAHFDRAAAYLGRFGVSAETAAGIEPSPWRSTATAVTWGYGVTPHVEKRMAPGVLECIAVPGHQALAPHVSPSRPLAFAVSDGVKKHAHWGRFGAFLETE